MGGLASTSTTHAKPKARDGSYKYHVKAKKYVKAISSGKANKYGIGNKRMVRTIQEYKLMW